MTKMICKKCNSELPEGSKFCQYCGSSDIKEVVEEKKNFKRCMDCGKELPLDSDFCQYCGSKRVAIINNEIKQNSPKTNSHNYKTAFIITLVIAICAICGTIYYSSMYSDAYNSIVDLSSENQTLSSENTSLKTKLNTAEGYKTKASNYDEVLNYAKNSKGYSDFYARQTILYKPNNQKVWIYLGHYNTTISYQASSYAVSANWGSFSGLWVPITISYSGSGVEYIKFTNSANSESFYITIVG